MSEQIRREFTLAFPIEKVKKAIRDTCRTSPGGRQLKDYNETFGTYSVTLVRNLYILPTTITLKAISESETHFELSAIPGQHLSRMAAFASSMIEDFLKQIGEFAAGRLTVKVPTPAEAQADAKKKGSAALMLLVMIVVVIAAVSALIYFMDK